MDSKQDEYYMFIQKVSNTDDGEYEEYFRVAAEYVSNVIWLTNSLLLVLLTYFKVKGLSLPCNSMVSTFVHLIKKEKLVELFKLIPHLEKVSITVNLAKHSIVGFPPRKNCNELYFWDMKKRQSQILTQQSREQSISEIQSAIKLAKEKLKMAQKSR